MSIGKLALLGMTLFGLVIGVMEGIRLTGGLAVIIIAQVLLFGAAMAMLVHMARKDRKEAARPETGPEAPQARPTASGRPLSSGRP